MCNAQLSFDYDDSSGEYVAEYRGLIIAAPHDSSAENPFEAFEGELPMASQTGRGFITDNADLLDPMAHISNALLRRHMGAILNAFDSSDRDYITKESADNRRYYGGSLTDHKRDAMAECLAGMVTSDRMDTAAAIYRAIGWPALATCSCGYSQGDYANLLFVVTPEWRERMGIDRKASDWSAEFEAARKLWGAWAWGDVYGFVIRTPEGQALDSCWGFYGHPDDRNDSSGIQAAARASADHILATAQTRRLQALRVCVANRVPLDKRPAILASAGAPA